MKEGYKLLGDYIRQVDERNIEGEEDNLLGVSVQKVFIPSIANTNGTDFTKYKIVKKRQFTYIPDTSRRGDKIAIALLDDYDEGLVSNVYTVFEVIDENKLLPEYLIPHFTVHNLRHTFCTRLCENQSNEVTLKVIQEIMGHADISTTLDVYTDLTTQKKQQAFGCLQGKIKLT